MMETDTIDAHLHEIEQPIHHTFTKFLNGSGFRLSIQEDPSRTSDIREILFEIDQNKKGALWRVDGNTKIDNDPLPDDVAALMELASKAIKAKDTVEIEADRILKATAKAFFSDKLSSMPSPRERARLTYLQNKLFSRKP